MLTRTLKLKLSHVIALGCLVLVSCQKQTTGSQSSREPLTRVAFMDLNQVTLPTTDLRRAVAFYKRLGFTQIVDAPPHYARFECRPEGASFSLDLVEAVAKDNQVVIYFECENLDQQVAELRKAGIQFEMEPTDQPWLWREARLRDPDGNRLCLYHAGRNRLYPPWRIATDGDKEEHF